MHAKVSRSTDLEDQSIKVQVTVAKAHSANAMTS